jgi:transposase-like protein
MPRQYRKFDQEFRDGAVQLVLETGKPIAQVARELGINEGTLGNWCARRRRSNEGGWMSRPPWPACAPWPAASKSLYGVAPALGQVVC